MTLVIVGNAEISSCQNTIVTEGDGLINIYKKQKTLTTQQDSLLPLKAYDTVWDWMQKWQKQRNKKVIDHFANIGVKT